MRNCVNSIQVDDVLSLQSGHSGTCNRKANAVQKINGEQKMMVAVSNLISMFVWMEILIKLFGPNYFINRSISFGQGTYEKITEKLRVP